MQAIMEPIFDLLYLLTVLTVGILMIVWGRRTKEYWLFGVLAVLLGAGDAFHLVPRICALWTTGMDHWVYALGIGKLVTSITMTVFYLLLYGVWRQRYQITGRAGLTIGISFLVLLRICLCLCPQNAWTSPNAPLSWGIYRNIPFALLGLILILLFYREAKRHRDHAYRFLWLAIAISFLCYLPVVLFADQIPLIGILMIPKTCAYAWVVLTGFADLRRSLARS